MAYGSGNTPWQDFPSRNTPINAKRLNAIETFIDKLKTRIDNIVSSAGDSNTEIVDARVSADNTTYQTLKGRLDAENQALAEEVDSLAEELIELGITYTENSEYIRAYTDADGRFLWGICFDGSIEWAKGIPGPIRQKIADLQSQIDSLGTVQTDNPEYLRAYIDSDGRFLFGIKTDGSIEWAKGIPGPVMNKFSEVEASIKDIRTEFKELNIRYIDDVAYAEYVWAITDSEERFLIGIKTDGSIELGKGSIPSEMDSSEYIQVLTDHDGKVLEAIGNDGVKRFYIPVQLKDASVKGKFRIDGTVEWNDNNLTELEAALKKHGFSTMAPVDWSDAAYLAIPEPRCAIANITGITSWPTSKFQNSKAWLEFWDCNGNYFKKRIIFNAQGNSSMVFVKKNGSIDLCNDEWEGEDTFVLKIGDWVSQDSFHAKAYYTDYFRGVAVVSYQLMNEIVKTRGLINDRPWKKALIDIDSVSSAADAFGGITSNSLELDTGARNFPDGFPCIFYLNGKFYGIYSWQLKKHRDNFHMEKDVAEHVWLDGTINATTLLGETVDWNSKWEVRNPKNLYLMDGTEYDADTNAGELMDETSDYYDLESDSSKVKKRKQTTAKVKGYINALSTVMATIKSAKAVYDGDKTSENLAALKETYETYFDVQNQIDYLILSDVVKNSDGFSKNWQWATYDGIKWYINLYDVDMSFGGHFNGNQITAPLTAHINNTSDRPSYYVIHYYEDELKARYKELRDAGIIDVEHIAELLNSWTKRIGVDMYDNEYDKWPDCSCAGKTVLNDGWELVEGEMGTSLTYDQNTTYFAGDTCTYGLNAHMGYFTFKATAESKGTAPVKTWKYHDSIYRVKKWLDEEIRNMDSLYEYLP